MIDNSIVLKIRFFCLMLIITLVFGLHPKDFGSEHAPSINSAGDLSFTKYAIATADVGLESTSEHNRGVDRFFLDVSLEIPEIPSIASGFSVVFSINNTQGYSQMLLGQWKRNLIIMSGDDYSNRLNLPRIIVPLDTVQGYVYPQPVRIRIKASATMTVVIINGQKMAQSTRYIVPLNRSKFTVSMGNTLNRKQGWAGSLREFQLNFFTCLSNDLNEDESHCTRTYAVDLHNVIHPPPDAGPQQKDAVQLPSSTWILHSPYTVLSTEWLSSKSMRNWNTLSFSKDVLINLLGFIPITLAIFTMVAIKYRPLATALITITATTLISLFIESAQLLLPSRTSSIVDLMTNSFAGMSTSLLCYLATRRRQRHRRRRHRKRRKFQKSW